MSHLGRHEAVRARLSHAQPHVLRVPAVAISDDGDRPYRCLNLQKGVSSM